MSRPVGLCPHFPVETPIQLSGENHPQFIRHVVEANEVIVQVDWGLIRGEPDQATRDMQQLCGDLHVAPERDEPSLLPDQLSRELGSRLPEAPNSGERTFGERTATGADTKALEVEGGRKLVQL